MKNLIKLTTGSFFAGLSFFVFNIFEAKAEIYLPTNTGLPDPPGSIVTVLIAFLYWILAVVGMVAIIGFVVSGILYLTSGGDEDQMKRGKRAFTYSIVGVVVALSGFVIIKTVHGLLGGWSWFNLITIFDFLN